MKFKPYGQIAYEAYCEFSGNKSLVNGSPLPKWDDVKTEIKQAWTKAALAVIEASQNENNHY